MPQFLASLIATVVSLPIIAALLRRRGILDVPNERSSHAVPVHRGGGLACFLGLVAGLIAVQIIHPNSTLWQPFLIVFALAGVGLADDIRTVSPSLRILAQIGAGLALGLLVERSLAWAIVGIILVPTIVNAVNFMDGINGITGFTATVWGATAIFVGHRADVFALQAIGSLTAGAALGFLPVNIPRARLFLGDVGSYLLGAIVAAGILIGAQRAESYVLIAPLSVYLVDTGFTILSRALNGEALTTPHRSHVYQRLVSDAGYSHVSAASYAAATAAGVTALWLFTWIWLAAVGTASLLGGYLASVSTSTRWRRGRTCIRTHTE